MLCIVDTRVPQAHPALSIGETQSWGAPWPGPAQEASELEHLQIHDTGLTASQAPRTAGPAPDSSLGAHRTARWRLPDRGVSATPDCLLHRNIYLFSHSTLELPGASAPPPPEAGQEVQRTQPGWGQPDWQDLGPGPLFVLRGVSATRWSLFFAPACLSLSWAGEGGGELCWE